MAGSVALGSFKVQGVDSVQADIAKDERTGE